MRSSFRAATGGDAAAAVVVLLTLRDSDVERPRAMNGVFEEMLERAIARLTVWRPTIMVEVEDKDIAVAIVVIDELFLAFGVCLLESGERAKQKDMISLWQKRSGAASCFRLSV